MNTNTIEQLKKQATQLELELSEFVFYHEEHEEEYIEEIEQYSFLKEELENINFTIFVAIEQLKVQA